MEIIKKYFGNLNNIQLAQLEELGELYKEWNAKINVVSRKDIDNIYAHHILHAMGIAKIVSFKSYTHILDVGTGGGLPGIPLAILFPDAKFHLIDATLKKIKVVNAIVKSLGLQNVVAEQKRVEKLQGKNYDFAISRGVAKLDVLFQWVRPLVISSKKQGEQYNSIPNGLLVLKGGDLTDELKSINRRAKVFALSQYFDLPFYETKKVVFVRL